MHESVLAWVADVTARHGLGQYARVLDVGSMDVNGTCRPLFLDAAAYLGVDIRPGPAVDQVVVSGGPLPESDPPWDVIVCTEMLEHDDAPWWTLRRMIEVAAPDCRLILTTRGIGFPLHEYPGDHWRFSCTGLRSLLVDNGWSPLEVAADPQHPGVFAIAAALP